MTKPTALAMPFRTYVDSTYVCSRTLRATSRFRQRDGFERAVLRIVDEELLRPEAAVDGERLVRETVDAFRRMSSVLRDTTFPLERRREVLRRLLPKRDGVRPILVYIDPNAGRGWRKALQRIVVRHLTTRNPPENGRSVGKKVSPAVAAKAEQPDAPRWDPFEGLAAWERELLTEDLESVPELFECGALA